VSNRIVRRAVLIVAGAFEVAPEEREEFLAKRHESMVRTRDEKGCLEYVLSADPVDPTRVVLFERWEDQAAFDAHLAGLKSAPQTGGPAPRGVTVEIYDVAGTRSFG
jgi:quinol monooxygenase YgiN